ncbi:MAG: hypothetical protein LBD34_01320 [Puniceicoccales bacterium]|jgi:hypothetical protein|nr:hypothetical protein [Puniceicoccales bacterium]
MKNFSKKDRCLQNTKSNFRRNLSKKIRKFSTAVKNTTNNALATKLPKIIEALKVMTKYVTKVDTFLAAKIVQLCTAIKEKAKNALATKLPKIIEVLKVMTKYATKVAPLLAVKIVQMCRDTKKKARKTVAKFRHVKTTLAPARSHFCRQSPKVFSKLPIC